MTSKHGPCLANCSTTCIEPAGAIAYRKCAPVQRLGIEPKMNARTVALIFGKFLYLFLASLILGLVLGLFSALLLKKYNVSQTPQVMLLTASSTNALETKQHQTMLLQIWAAPLCLATLFDAGVCGQLITGCCPGQVAGSRITALQATGVIDIMA